MLPIKHVTMCSLTDYQPYIASVIYLAGCNLRCGFCFNKELLEVTDGAYNEQGVVLNDLARIRHMVDAVVLTGGEPCINHEIVDFAIRIKEMGLKIRVNTNGMYPKIIQNLLKVVDLFSVDIKGPAYMYEKICGQNAQNLLESLQILKKYPEKCEFNVIFLPFYKKQDISAVGALIEGFNSAIVRKADLSCGIFDEGLISKESDGTSVQDAVDIIKQFVKVVKVG